jgi:hypothetical protein
MQPPESPLELGACSACYRRFLHRCERVELPLEVTTLDVAPPLMLVQYGDVTVFTITMAVEFVSEVSRSDACC